MVNLFKQVNVCLKNNNSKRLWAHHSGSNNATKFCKT